MTIEVSTFFPFLKVETVLSTTDGDDDGDDDGVDGANCNQLVRSIRMEILFCAKNKKKRIHNSQMHNSTERTVYNAVCDASW